MKYKQLIEDFYTFWETGDETYLSASTHKQLIDHDKNPAATGTDYDALLATAKMFNQSLSNITHNFIIESEIDENKLVIRWEGSAKHTGDLFGIPATGRTVYFNGHDIIKVKEGKISELWHIEQLFQLFSQLQ